MGLANVTLFPEHFVLCLVTLGKQCTLFSIVVSFIASTIFSIIVNLDNLARKKTTITRRCKSSNGGDTFEFS